MKNILFLEQFSNIAGGQRMLLQLLKGLDRSEFSSYVILPDKDELSKELAEMKIEYFIMPMPELSLGRKSLLDILRYFYGSLFLVPRVVRVIKDRRINLVYAKAPRTFFWGTIAARIARVPIVWQLHSVFKGLELKFALLTSKLGVARLVADSKTAARPFNKGNEDKIRVVNNGIETALFATSFDGKMIRPALGLVAGQYVFAYVGRITRLKGLADLIRAAAEVVRRRPEAVFLFAGRVFGAEDQAYFASLQALVKELGLTEKVRFVGFVEDLPRFLAAIDALVLPSIEPEAGPLAVLEAMAAGKLVIASDNGGQAEAITDGVDGYLFPAGDVKKLAALLQTAAAGPETARQMGERAQIKARRDHSLERYRENILKILREVI